MSENLIKMRSTLNVKPLPAGKRVSRFSYVVNTVTKVLLTVSLIPAVLAFLLSVYKFAFTSGYNYGLDIGITEAETYYLEYIEELSSRAVTTYEITDGKTPTLPPPRKQSLILDVSWGGS